MTIRIAPLEEVCEVNPRAPKNISDDTPVTFLPMSAVSEDGYVAFEESRTYGEVKKGYTYFERGDVLVAKITPCFENGKATSTETIQNKLGFGSTEFHVIRPSPDLDPKYVFYLLWSERFRTIGEKGMTGSAGQKRVPADLLKRLQIPLPPLEEQKRIAAILDKTDQLRQKRRQAIALLDSLTQSIFLEMFGDPVSNPKGWPVLPFGVLAKNCDSIRIPVKQSDRDKRSGPYPYYGSVGVIDDIDGFLFEGEHLLISEDGKHLQSRSRPIACIANGKFWVNNHAHVVKTNGRADLLFLRSFFEISSIDKYISGIDQIKLNRKSMDKISIPLPPINMQEQFRKVIEKLEIQKKKLDQMDEILTYIFSSLQHRAFSGQL